MKKFSEKIVKVAGEAKELIEKIMRWRAMELDRLLRVKYEPHKPSAKSHFEAIMADVNEEHLKVEEMLKLHALAEEISGNKLVEGFDKIDISDAERAQIEYQKELKRQKEMQISMEMKNKR